MAQAPNDNDPSEQARNDPGFLRAVAAAHHGRWAVADALWWLEHPDLDAPGGAPSPAIRLRALQRRLFAEDGDAAGNAAVAVELRRLEEEIRGETTAIAEAVRVASDLRERLAAPSLEVRPATEDAHQAAPAEPEGPRDRVPAARPAPARARRGWLVGLSVALALVVGVAAGSLLSAGSLPGAAEPTPAPTTEPPQMSSAGAVPATTQPLLAAQVFGRPQTSIDRPLTPLPEVFDPATFRYLGSAGFTDADGNGVTDSPYYAVRGADRMICLVAVPEGSGYLATCAHDAEYPSAGLRLSWQSTDILPAADDGTVPMVLDITVAWLRDSSIETRGSGRQTNTP